MTPCCTNCVHWDEETAEDNVGGLAICTLLSPTLLDIRDWKRVAEVRTRGDERCDKFTPKLATPAPEPPTDV